MGIMAVPKVLARLWGLVTLTVSVALLVETTTATCSAGWPIAGATDIRLGLVIAAT
jgi:hypothetical protein